MTSASDDGHRRLRRGVYVLLIALSTSSILGRILAVTADDVKRVANTYLDPGNLLTVIVRAGAAAPAPGGQP